MEGNHMSRDITFEGFLQNDPRWNEQEAWPADEFPDADYHYMRECGCLVCAIADLLRFYGIETETDERRFNPFILNRRLIQCGGFFSTANLDVGAISSLYPIEYRGSARYSREKLAELIGKGMYCLITVSGRLSAVHFLAVTGLTPDDAVVMDPHTGKRYLSEYSQIYEIRFFSQKGNKQNPTASLQDPDAQEAEGLILSPGELAGMAGFSVQSAGGAPPRIALTFDDGPSEETTDRILSILEENGARATFFVIGNKVEKHAALLRRMVRNGCQIGNHGWDHDSLRRLTPEKGRLSIEKTSDAILRACGTAPVVMRSPGGETDSAILKTVEDLGLSCIKWSVDPWDWKTRNARETLERVLREVSDGDIVLLHDIYTETADAARYLIPELVRRGFSLVTLEELASDRGGLEPGRLYRHL